MKKTYMTPATEIVAISKNDIIVTSVVLGEEAKIQFFNDGTVYEGY